MRDTIADAAAALFDARGFDHVTVDEIAAAADVGRKTVFNHFPRKEDLFFDRIEAIQDILRKTLTQRGPGVAPIEAYRLLAHRLVAEESPYIEFSPASQAFVRTLEGSETLKARARSIRDELAQTLAAMFSECVGRDPADADADLAAHMIMAAWTVARIQAHRTFLRSADTKEARAVFLAVIDKATLGLRAAVADSPYV